MNHWNYQTQEYKDETHGFGRYDFNYSSLNSNIERKNPLEMDTAGGGTLFIKITWKEAIDISIGDLPAVKVKYMIVPVKYIEDLNVIGMDIICKHTLIMSSKNGNMDLKILPSELIEENQTTLRKVTSTVLSKTDNLITNIRKSVSNPFRLMDIGLNNFDFLYENNKSELRFNNYVGQNNIFPISLEEILKYIKIYNEDLKISLRVGIVIDNNLINSIDFEDI